ncbi:predicted protein [Naegleria gruberi]|uniref:Predicted protein n=1 Tax=Naegleria gruberi TaxID=5762 RepID=D2VH55_NAEGR|nr:uncharacterized protein NAEGRDRAFT_49543 [Naegleria gruberi]EFC43834.1 predicted protein [Naegleria gruberi]|eukprot:XP_002676578.1 predicted protein [Naegleria gruberi strain NEG-M]
MCEEFEKSTYPQDMDEQTREQKAEELFKIATKEEEDTDNLLEVFNMYREAADLGHGPSREKFARLCLIDENNEFGIDSSPELAFNYMKKAAIENGSHTALFQLGNYFMKGIGTEKNYENALICFVEHTIIDGNPTSMFNIGVLYHEGGSGGNGQSFKKDYKKAYVWWKIALNRGHALSAYNIGILLKSGDGVDKSLVKAFQYFKLANFMSEKIQIPTDVLIAIQEQQFNVFKGEEEIEHDSPTDSNQIDENEETRNMDFMDEKPFKELEKNLVSEEEEDEEYVDEELDITSKSSQRSRSPFNPQSQDATLEQDNEDMEEILRQLSESNGKVSPKTTSRNNNETTTSTNPEPSIGWKVAEYALTIGAVIGMGFLLKKSTEFH